MNDSMGSSRMASSSEKRPATTLYKRAAAVADPYERVARTAYDLFSRHGIVSVGVDQIIAKAHVAKMTLYRRFRSKDELALFILDRREERWTVGWLKTEVNRRSDSPEERLLAIFDVFGEWFGRPDYEGCLFINSLLEAHGTPSAIGAASAEKLANAREIVRELAEEAGIRDPASFAVQWQILMCGAIVMAQQGGVDAAPRAREVASLFLERELRR
jgi:AcrR family transcriptional regulator